jgi:tRNA threonylcarbamoyladenosine biosynthesis protein TsaB
VSVALRWRSARGEILVREVYEERETGHAERLLPMIEAVMHGAGQTFATIDRIAVTLGPGSFTGLRIGIATARALALATKIPIVGMTSLAVMAARADHLLGNKRGTRPLIVAVDARRDHIYTETFGENAGDSITEARLITANAAARNLASTPVMAVGTGAKAFARESSNPEHVTVILPTLQPHARFLAIIAPALKIQDTKVHPHYLRNADAKAQTGATLPKANS